MVKKNISVFIATPMYGGMCHGSYAKSIFNTMKFLLDRGIDVQFRDIYNNSIITNARNILTQLFLKSNSTHLFFADADQSFKPEDVLRMIEEDRDVIGGIAPKKQINWDSVAEAVKFGVPTDKLKYASGNLNVGLLPNQPYPEDFKKSFEVSYIPTGMMIIKRSVFDKMKGSVLEYTYSGDGVLGINHGDKIHQYWECGIDDGRFLCEDVNFCHIWRGLGEKVYAAPYAKITHIGSYEFSGLLDIRLGD